MKTATAMTGDLIPTIDPRQALWQEFYRALAGRNFIRAIDLARRLDISEERIRFIQRDALKLLIAEYQNFDAATILCADYCITAEEFSALIEEVLRGKELTSRRTFTMRSGNPAHLSVAEQIREYAQQQIESLKKRERRRSHKSRWRRALLAVKSWFDWRSGLRRPGGTAYL
jgi:hypothetical protein